MRRKKLEEKFYTGVVRAVHLSQALRGTNRTDNREAGNEIAYRLRKEEKYSRVSSEECLLLTVPSVVW